MGFERSRMEQLFVEGRPRHASTWIRGPAMVDLHRTLVGLGVSAEEGWLALSPHTETWTIGRVEVEVFPVAARCLVLALHVAQHGPEFARTRDDLERAIARVPQATWAEAAALGRSLEAETSMAAGFLAVDGGQRLAATLGLRLEGTVVREGSTSFHAAQGLLWLIKSRGIRAKVDYLRIKLFPPSSVMRSRAAWARSSWAALALAYGVRLARIAFYAPRAAWALAQFRRKRHG
jgi:hypothetical protein